MLIALALLALVLTLSLSAYFLYRVSCDIRYNLGLMVDRLDTMNDCNDHALETQCNVHLDYVQWRKEDMDRIEQQEARTQQIHELIVESQEAQRTGAISIAQNVESHTALLQQMVAFATQQKRSHHKKAVQEQVTEQLATSEVQSVDEA